MKKEVMNNDKKHDVVLSYIYRDTVANLAMGVDVAGEFYKTALCSDISHNLDLELGDVHIAYINGYVDFILAQPDVVEHAKSLGVVDAIQLIQSLPSLATTT